MAIVVNPLAVVGVATIGLEPVTEDKTGSSIIKYNSSVPGVVIELYYERVNLFIIKLFKFVSVGIIK
jgi:hypothetical protein